MALPRSSVQLMALCLSLLCSLVYFLGSSSSTPVSLKNRIPGDFLHAPSLNATTILTEGLPSDASDDILAAAVDETENDPISDVHNATLGFQKIYAISMPSRTDKRDYLALMGLVSGLEIDFADGVNGSEMHPRSYPSYWKGAVAVGDYGVWRAHLNVYQDMVQNRVQTALILEDDADWDVLLRHQMTDFAYGTRALQNATLPLRSPYGDNWDLLALGHIGVNNKVNKQQRYWVTPNDPTVIAESRRTWSRKPDVSTPKLAGDHTRIVLEVSKFTGAAAYALSLRGAATLLYDQSMLPNAQAIDVAMLALCRHDPYDTPFCLGAYPMIFGRYRAIGPVSKDSDRRTMSNDVEPGTGGFQSGQERKKPESEFTVFSTSLNIWRLMKGERVIPACVPDADLQKEVDLDHIAFPRGEVVEVEPEEYKDYQAALAEQRKKEDQAKEKQVEEEQKELKKDDDKKVRRWAA